MPRTIRVISQEIDTPLQPFELFAGLKNHKPSFFLDSACEHAKLGRYSYLGFDPFLIFRSKGDKICLEWAGGRRQRMKADPFTILKDLLDRYAVSEGPVQGAPCGAVGYFAYDLKNFIETLPDSAEDDLGISDCVLGFYSTVAAYDHMRNKWSLSATGLPTGDRNSAKASMDEFRRMIDCSVASRPSTEEIRTTKLTSNFSKAAYIRAVEKAKEYIRRGDVYQVNLSQRFEAPLLVPPKELYRRLRFCNPAPFAAYLDFKDVAILSSSPERFLRRRGSRIETRPIKGTRPRGSTVRDDRAMARELAKSPKDKAEHVMIVDLERNDLGRICEYGSVRPTESSIIEKYASVFHLVSNISGTLRDGVDSIDCLRATFPGGSITGAPKIRSMEIIDELEGLRRSVYTGAIGYLGFDGCMDTSIAIRTFIIKKGRIYFQVGGGIVADSDPQEEYEETLHKAQGLMDALGANL